MLTLHRRDSLVRILVTGKHRARFLHAMTTAEIQKLPAGQATLALVATANGRHVGQMRIEAEEASLSLVTEATSLDPIVETLKKHKVADDVKFGPIVEGELTIALYGEVPDIAREGITVTRWDATQSELGVPTVHARGAREAVEALVDTLRAAGAVEIDRAEWDRRRVLNGWPLDGVDIGIEDQASFSDRLLAAVSWNKGCFLGQEAFVMTRDRGEVPKKLRGVLTHGELRPGTSLVTSEGKAAATVGSGFEGHALAVVKRKQSEPGTILTVEDGRAATVVALPFSG